MSWGNPQTKTEKVVSGVLAPASLAFGLGSYCRIMSYNLGLFKQEHFSCPVISIGNLTCGGTGKTPVVVDLTERLAASGHKVGILSRGYKRKSHEKTVTVSDGKGTIADPADSGDEPYMMAKSVPEAVVIVGSRRTASAKLALAEHHCDVLVLDDGFQHFPIARDIDIVLVDYNDDLLNDSLLPSGRLREPVSALVRAQWIVITKVPAEPDSERLAQFHDIFERFAPHARITSCCFPPAALTPFDCPDVALVPQSLAGTNVLAFSGIARPENFSAELKGLGASIVAEKHFGDHHWYTQADIEGLRALCQSSQAEMLVTTEKDAVRLSSELVKDLPVATLKLKCAWLGEIPLEHGLPARQPPQSEL